MKKTIWLMISLLCLCASCAGGDRPMPKKYQTASDIAPDAAVDKSCAYFYFLWGKQAEFAGRLQEAVEAYEKALVCDAEADHVMSRLAMLLIKVGRPQQALSLMETITARNPDNLEARSLLANLYSAIGDFEKAAEIYQAILAIEPDNSNTMLYLGSLYARNQEYDKARKVLENLIRLDPESFVGHHYLAKLYREQQLFDKSVTAYKKALGLHWSVMLSLELAELFEYRERNREAIAIYKSILKEDEANEKVRGRLAGLYLRLGKVDQALDELRELRHYGVDRRQVDFTIGRILMEKERVDDAIVHFSSMLEEEPGLEMARYMLAVSHYRKGNKETAKKLLRMIPVKAGEYENAVLMLAAILQEEKNTPAVEKVLKENIADKDRRSLRFYIALATVYQEQKRNDEAEQLFQQAVAEYPTEPKVFFEYGLFLERSGDIESAIDKMQKVLELDPQDPYALNYVGYTWADTDRNLDKALEYIKQAVALKPDDGYIRDSLGWVYFKLGDITRAIREFEKAIELKDDDPTIHEHLGDVYLKDGRIKKALASYKRAMGLYEDEEKKQQVRRKIEAVKK